MALRRGNKAGQGDKAGRWDKAEQGDEAGRCDNESGHGTMRGEGVASCEKLFVYKKNIIFF